MDLGELYYQEIIKGALIITIEDIQNMKREIEYSDDFEYKKQMRHVIRRMLDAMQEAYGPGGLYGELYDGY